MPDARRDDHETANVAVQLSMAMLRLRARLREEAGAPESGLTVTQLAILQRILAEGPVTAASLAIHEHVSQQAIAQNVAVLKSSGWVEAERDTADKRKVLLVATDAGRDLFESMLASRRVWLVQAIDALLEPGERPALLKSIELLERLAEAPPDF